MRTLAPVDSENAGFSEKETAAIIKRALELQHRAGGSTVGLTLEEIQRIGSEVGINSELIQRAAEELAEIKNGTPDSFWLGAALIQGAQSDVSGPKRALADLIPVIEEAAERDGRGALTSNALQWRSRLGQILVRVKNEGEGRTRIRADIRIGEVAVSLFPALTAGLGLGAGLGAGIPIGLVVLHSPLFMVLFPIGMVAASFLLARRIFKLVARSATQRARKIVEAVHRALLGGV